MDIDPSTSPHFSKHPAPIPATAKHSGKYAECGGGMHPSGMQYCYIFFYFIKLTTPKEV